MEKSDSGEFKNDKLKYLQALSREGAIRILIGLCEDDALADRIIATPKMLLAEVDAEEIADEVFESLNSIRVEDLWDNSGKTRWGYRDTTEVAFEMIENEVLPYINKMEQFASLNMKREEKEFCKGILAGVLRYGAEGSNEFYDWAPDDPYTVAENIIYGWKMAHTAEDIEEIQSVYDSFFSEDDADED